MSAFKNAPNTDFSIAANREKMRLALAKGIPSFDVGGKKEKFATPIRRILLQPVQLARVLMI